MKTQTSVFVLAVVGSVVLLNLIGLRLFGRADITRDGVYTLSAATKETMSSLTDDVVVTAYFTESLPPPYASNARYVRDLLEEFRAASKGKLAFEFIDPAAQETDADKEAKREVKRDIFGRQFREQTSVEKELANAGVQPVEIRVFEADQQQTKRAYMGVVLKRGESKEVIPVVQNVTELEYELTSLVRKLTRTKAPVIGVLQGHDELKLNEKFQFLQTALSQTYEVKPVELAGKDRIDPSIDAIFVLGPTTALPPNELKAIDQFLMEGRSAAFFLDTMHVDVRSFAPTPAAHGLTQLLASYGITVGDRLVTDVAAANINVSERRGYMIVQMPVPYPFIPIVKHLSPESPVSRGLGEVIFPFASPVDVKAPEGAQGAVLARSSAKSWLDANPPNIDPRRDWRSETPVPDGPHPLMVQLSGKLKSHFAAEATQSGSAPMLAESKADVRVIAVGTSAIFQDDFINSSRGNQALLMNVADWLALDPALLAMRSRGVQLATLKADLPDGTRNFAKYGNALGLPLGLALFGLVRWRMREAKRAQITL